MHELSVKKALNLIDPSKMAYIVSYDAQNGRSNVMAATWHMRSSKKPESITIALWKEGYTHTLIQKEKEFVFVVPDESLLKHVSVVGRAHGDKVAKIEKLKIKTATARNVKASLLSDAYLNFECKLLKEVEFDSDHVLFIGEVLCAYTNDESLV